MSAHPPPHTKNTPVNLAHWVCAREYEKDDMETACSLPQQAILNPQYKIKGF